MFILFLMQILFLLPLVVLARSIRTADKLFLLRMRAEFVDILGNVETVNINNEKNNDKRLMLLTISDPLLSLVQAFARYEKARKPDPRIEVLLGVSDLRSLAYQVEVSYAQPSQWPKISVLARLALTRAIIGVDRIIADDLDNPSLIGKLSTLCLGCSV